MPRSKKYARIAITLPSEDLAAADKLAAALDRPRSWVVAEAIRQYAAAARGPSAGPPLTPGLGPSRQQQLVRDMELTPEQRVREAEESAGLTSLGEPKGTAQHVWAFDDYTAYVDWKRRRGG
jgi:hypothetical protein